MSYPFLNGYKIMWMYVMFDLPVTEKNERTAATKFRNGLLDLGFQMAQFSVYYRCMASKEWGEKYEKTVQKMVPERGKVDIMLITDKQFSMQKRLYGQMVKEHKGQEQLVLF